METEYGMTVSDLDPEAIAEAHAAAVKAKEDADATRDFVLAHFQKLRGQIMPMEILGIQNLPNHSCLIVNDLLLLSYVEAEQLINRLANLKPTAHDVFGRIDAIMTKWGFEAPAIGETNPSAFAKVLAFFEHCDKALTQRSEQP